MYDFSALRNVLSVPKEYATEIAMLLLGKGSFAVTTDATKLGYVTVWMSNYGMRLLADAIETGKISPPM